MAITHVRLADFLVFKDEFEMNFSYGVNVIIGENGVGKTTLIKTLYVMWHLQIEEIINGNMLHQNPKAAALVYEDLSMYFPGSNFFEPGLGWEFNENLIKRIFTKSDEKLIEVTYEIKEPMASSFIFIPQSDTLTQTPGLLALDRERILPFDKTYIDIISKAALPVTRQTTPIAKKCLSKIIEIINGEVLYENDAFYTLKVNGEKLPFSLEASGYRKFGLLWKLLRNGLLEKGSILFWDEPENSLNPELIPHLIEILLILAQNGVQIFIATHDYDIARYFDVRKDKNTPVMFHNLSKEKNMQIICNTSPEYLELPGNLLETASADLFNAVVANAIGVQDDE